jgi:hypothetical protein
MAVRVSGLALIAAASITAGDHLVGNDADAGPTTKRFAIADVRTAILQASGAGWTATDYLSLGAAPASGRVRIGHGTITTADSPLINASVTWNDAAVTFNGILVNVTDTASNAASLLADLRVGGSSKFSVSKTGAVSSAAGLAVVTGGISVLAGTTAVQALTATTGVFSSTINSGAITSSGAITGTDLFAGTGDAVRWTARTRISSPADGTLLFQQNAGGGNFNKLCFGGTTSAFPMIKQNVASFDLKLADDSGFASMSCNNWLAFGNGTISGTLNGQTISSAASFTGTMAVAGAITAGTYNGQTISSAANFTGTITTAGAINGQTIGSAAAFTGTLSVASDFAIATNKFTVAGATGNTAIAGTLNVTGLTTVGDLTINGALTLPASLTLTGTLTASVIQTLGATTGSLVGGATVDIAVPVGVSIMSAQASTPSAGTAVLYYIRRDSNNNVIATALVTNPGGILVTVLNSTQIRLGNNTGQTVSLSYGFLRIATGQAQ